MNEFLLKLAGARIDQAGSIVGVHFELQPAVRWGLFSALVLLALAVAVLSYRRRDVDLSRGRRFVLTVLRILVLLGLVSVLLRPGLGLRVEGLVRQSIVLLLDQSASMALRDPRTEPDDAVRAAIASRQLPVAGGLRQTAPPPTEPRPSRLDLLRSVLTNADWSLTERLARDFDLKASGFAGGVISLGAVEDFTATNRSPAETPGVVRLAQSLRAQGRESAPGTALREVLDRERGRPLAGILLATDGIWNAGADPRDAAQRARDAGVAVHVIALGTTQPRDLQVAALDLPEVAFVRDEVPVGIRLKARGLAGQTVNVGLRLNGETVDQREVILRDAEETVVPMKFTPATTGDYEVAVEVPARNDEILAENNRDSRRLRVVDDRIRILLVEQSPRWEFRYLQALLLRDRRVELKCVLFDGDPAIARVPDAPYLESFPTRREDLFTFDLIIFGDVDPRHFTPSQLEIVSDFVARSGGSFLMIAGRRFSPWSYRDTPLERLLPVDFERTFSEPPGAALHDRPVRLALTPDGRKSTLLRLSEDPDENARRWEALPPIFWTAPVRRAKPAAEILVAEPARTEDAAPIPVIAMQQYGVGRSMFIGTDNTWRWRRNEGEPFYVSFWGRVVQRLAIHHLLSGSRRTQLRLDRPTAVPGERIGVSARLYTTAFEPLPETAVPARIQREPAGDSAAAKDRLETEIAEITLRAVPDQPGFFQGEIVAPNPGRYRLQVGDDAPAAVDFTVEDRLVEAGETALQETLLRDLASISGGAFFREEDLGRLPDVVESNAQRIESRLSVNLWSSPAYYLALLAVLALEWILRKWWQLK